MFEWVNWQNSRTKEQSDCCTRVPGLFVLLGAKRTMIERQQEEWKITVWRSRTTCEHPPNFCRWAAPSPTHGAERDIQIQKERMPTFVDILFALQVGLEPTTPWLTVRCSNRLSYWRIFVIFFVWRCKSSTSFCDVQIFRLFFLHEYKNIGFFGCFYLKKTKRTIQNTLFIKQKCIFAVTIKNSNE